MENGFTQLSPSQSNGHFELLAMTAGELLQSMEPQKVVESICRKVMEQVECHAFFNYLVDEQRGKLHLNACAGIPDEEARRIEWLDYGVAVCGCVARDGSRIVAEHISTTPDVRTDLVRSYGIKAYACHPLLGPGGKIIGTLSFGTCSRETFSEEELSLMKTVTDLVATAMNRMENEEAIRRNQRDLARAQEVGNIGSWRINVRMNVLSWSDENYRIFGISKGPALTYERFLSLVHPDDRSYVDARWSAALRGEPYDIEHRIVANGRVKWVRERAYLEFDDGGTLIGGFGIAQDITERKRAEEALLMAQADLELRVEERTRELTIASESVRTERQRLFDVLETLPVYVILLTPEHRIPFANRFFRERFGESGGRRCYEYLFKRAEPCEICETFTVLRTNAPHHWYWTGPDGRDYDIYDYPFVDSDGSTLILEMGIDITDQNRAQKALGLMNEKLVRMVKETEDLYNNAPCGYHSVDENGIIMRINDTELRWLGYSREEIVGKKRFRDLLTPESRHVVEMTFPVFKKQGSVADLVLDARRRDGSILPVLMSATAIYDGAGKYVMSRSMLYDLTERKKTEQQNSATNALLSLYARTVGRREYLDAAVDLLRKWSGCRRVGIRIADGQGSIPYASCIGFSSEFLESENALSLERDHCACTRVVLGIPEPQDLPAMTRAGSFYSNNTLRFVEGLSEEEKNRFRGVCVRTGFLSVAVVPMRYRDKVLGALHVADEREGMFSPESVEFLEQVALIIGEAVYRFGVEEERMRIASALESTADGIAVTHPADGRIEYVNPAFERITGYSRDEAVRRNLHLLDSGKHDETFFADIRSVIQRDGIWSGRLVNKKKDGTLYFEDRAISPVRDESGKIVNFVSVMRDVTEKIRLESIAESVNLMNNIGYIFSGVRHEIGNPINSAKMLLSVLQLKLESASKEKIKESIDRSLGEIRRVEHLLRSLKNFNMYENPEPRELDLAGFMQGFMKLIEEDFANRKITVRHEVAADAGSSYVDPRVLQQALINIVTNAADAVAGRDEPAISLTVKRELGSKHIIVSDNGVGMTDQQKKDLFKPFYTSKQNGTGLGLVIVKKMLARMNCDISITSVLGKGTVADISIPEGNHG